MFPSPFEVIMLCEKLCIPNIDEGAGLTETFNPASTGDYYFCGKIADESSSVFAAAPSNIVVNTAPTFSFTQPVGD